MTRSISSILAACFIFWLLPLGAFIKSSQEQLACNGQRAICMCSKLLTKDGKPTKLFIFVSAAPQKESSPGGASHQFIAAESKHFRSIIVTSLLVNSAVIQSSDYLRVIDHVPKV